MSEPLPRTDRLDCPYCNPGRIDWQALADSAERRLDTILNDPTYEGGVAYWRDRADAGLLREAQVHNTLTVSEIKVRKLECIVEQLQCIVDEAARCFYGPEETKPGTWGHEVAAKLHALSSQNKGGES